MNADRRRARQERLVALLEAEGLDGMLVSSRANIRYLTGFSGSAAMAIVTRHDALLVTDFRYDEQANQQAGAVARVAVERTSVWERLFKELAAFGPLAVMGYEAHVLTVRDAGRLTEQGAAWKWKPAGELVERLRMRKDPAEVAAISAAAALASEAFREVLGGMRPGRSELEIAGTLEAALRRRGSTAHPFPVIVASGPRTAWPHAESSSRVIERGNWLLLDFGAVVDGYCADITRTVVVGTAASDTQRALYEVVRGAQERARTLIRAGQTGKEADALARDAIAATGFGDAFGHSLGHGLGLEVHEGPRVSSTNLEPLPQDAVVTIEPGVYLAGQGGVRIEDDVHLSAAGPVLLSDGKTELLEVV